jgi:hypothetical protein
MLPGSQVCSHLRIQCSALKPLNSFYDLILITWPGILMMRCAPGAPPAQRHQ